MDKKIGVLVRREVVTVMREMFSDPEAGLGLTLDATRRIKRSEAANAAGKYKPLKAVLKKYRV